MRSVMEGPREDHPGTISISITAATVYTFWGFVFVFLVLALFIMGITPLNPHYK